MWRLVSRGAPSHTVPCTDHTVGRRRSFLSFRIVFKPQLGSPTMTAGTPLRTDVLQTFFWCKHHVTLVKTNVTKKTFIHMDKRIGVPPDIRWAAILIGDTRIDIGGMRNIKPHEYCGLGWFQKHEMTKHPVKCELRIHI